MNRLRKTITRLDRRALRATAWWRTGRAGRALRVLSQTGSTKVALPLTGLAAAALAATDRTAARRTVGVAAVAGLLAATLQHLCYRRRPPEGWVEKRTSSFPSTHSLVATACYGSLARDLLRPPRHSGSRVAAAACLGAAALVPISRVLLGMHWLSDAVASAAMGGTLAALPGRRWRGQRP